MRVHMLLAGLALAMAVPAQAEARIVYYRVFTPPPPNIATDREYDRAKVQARVHGRWPDGGVHGGWNRGERLPLAVAADAQPVDWRRADLYAPDEDTRWTRVGDDYVLIGNRTRQIRAVVLAPVANRAALIPVAVKKKAYVKRLKAKAHP